MPVAHSVSCGLKTKIDDEALEEGDIHSTLKVRNMEFMSLLRSSTDSFVKPAHGSRRGLLRCRHSVTQIRLRVT
jgi:hypothetical protein